MERRKPTRERTGLHRDPADEAFLAPLIATARAALPDAAYARPKPKAANFGYENALDRGARALRGHWLTI